MEIYDGASYRINIEGMDSTLIVDSYRGIIKANIVDADEYIIVDYENKTFYGTLVGNIVNDVGTVIFDYSERLINGNLSGNVIDELGNIIVDNSLQLFYGHLVGNLTDDMNSVIVDKDERLFFGSVVGNVVDDLGNTVVDKNLKTFFGNVSDTEGNTVLDAENKIFIGNITGNIIDHTGNIVYDSVSGILTIEELEVNNLIQGNIKGNVYSATGNLAYDSLTNSADFDELILKTLTVNEITVNDTVVGNFLGTFSGNIYNSLGEVFIDINTESIKTNLLSENEGISYDYLTNTFYGNFVGQFLTTDYQFNTLEVGDRMNGIDGTLSIFSEKDLEDDYNPLSIYVSKENTLPGVLSLVRTRGTIDNTKPVIAGDRLNGILFGAQSGGTSDSLVPVALLEVVVPDNTVVQEGKIEGQFNLKLSNNNGEINTVLSVEANGCLHTKIKNLTVVGETENVPVNTSTPDSWLEITVNGNKKFIPLYS